MKLRQSAMGGVITNDLKSKLDKMQTLKGSSTKVVAEAEMPDKVKAEGETE